MERGKVFQYSSKRNTVCIYLYTVNIICDQMHWLFVWRFRVLQSDIIVSMFIKMSSEPFFSSFTSMLFFVESDKNVLHKILGCYSYINSCFPLYFLPAPPALSLLSWQNVDNWVVPSIRCLLGSVTWYILTLSWIACSTS